jgi:hypothetical protein
MNGLGGAEIGLDVVVDQDGCQQLLLVHPAIFAVLAVVLNCGNVHGPTPAKAITTRQADDSREVSFIELLRAGHAWALPADSAQE